MNYKYSTGPQNPHPEPSPNSGGVGTQTRPLLSSPFPSFWGRVRGEGFGGLLLALALLLPLAPTGCARLRAAVKPAAPPFSPEGRWRSSMLGVVMTAHLQPDGTLEMIDPRGHRHPFQRIAPNQWKARISREAIGSFHPEGDQLVFRIEPAPEASKPIAQKNGLTIVHSVKPREDRMTRVP